MDVQVAMEDVWIAAPYKILYFDLNKIMGGLGFWLSLFGPALASDYFTNFLVKLYA